MQSRDNNLLCKLQYPSDFHHLSLFTTRLDLARSTNPIHHIVYIQQTDKKHDKPSDIVNASCDISAAF